MTVESASRVPPHSARQALPKDALLLELLGVSYVHLTTAEGGDLYLVTEALSAAEHLQPENWLERAWFDAHAKKLRGTSAVYDLSTRPVHGESVRLVVKYCRVGQHVPFQTLQHDVIAEFNGPFEEFSLLEEARRSTRGAPIELQSPLAIYVPPERMQLWQTGRSEATIASKIARYPGVAIDILRDYILVYRWLPGLDAADAHDAGLLGEAEMEQLTLRAIRELDDRGYRVLDMKPAHIIVQPDGAGLRRTADGELAYGLVDFELLERTPEHQAEVGALRQRELERAAASSTLEAPALPPHLAASRIFGVDYTFGRVESTGGALWVAGRDPTLFDYFLPERWRQTPHIQLDPQHSTFYTRSKDGLQIVWKVSRVGEPPSLDGTDPSAVLALEHGVNSPFEDVALASLLRRGGVMADAPYAIYMTGHDSRLEHRTRDWRRYRSHEHLLMPNGDFALRPARNYVTLWSFGGSTEVGREYQDACTRAMNGDQALSRSLISRAEMDAVLESKRAHIEATGIVVLKLLPHQILLSLDSQGRLLRDAHGRFEIRLCSFDFLKLPAAITGVPEVAPFVPPGVRTYGPASTHTDLHALLASRRELLVTNTYRRVRASGAPHYATQPDEEVERRMSQLVSTLIEATESTAKRDHVFVDHMRRIAAQRIREGFSVAEVQLGLGCLQEEAWSLCADEIEDRQDLLRCLTSITSIISHAKDELGLLFLERKYPVGVEVAPTHHPLDDLLDDHRPPRGSP